MKKLRVLDLFSGIGGFSLGLERTGGFETVAFCEIEPFCRKVLAKHWPKVPIYEDVKTFTAKVLEKLAPGRIDTIVGGFPCQDISYAGRGTGIEGDRSGLWAEYARIIGELRPSYVIVENTAALLSRGLGRVLGDLAFIGYDAEWHCISASDIDAPHSRERIWVVAYPTGVGQGQLWGQWCAEESTTPRRVHWPEHQPPSQRVVDGIPDRLDRCTAIGNAVVPQIPEMIGNAILESLKEKQEAA